VAGCDRLAQVLHVVADCGVRHGVSQPAWLPRLRWGKHVVSESESRNREGKTMKIAVIGGTGLIGSQVVKILNAGGHQTVMSSPCSGLDLVTAAGIPGAAG